MLKHLTIIEMRQLINPWIRPTKRRAVFLSITEIAGLHGKITQIHDELVSARPPLATTTAELRAIIEEAEATDVVHDALARAIHSGLLAERAYALAYRPPALERARKAEDATEKLFPDGLAIINASLLVEAGNTARVAALLQRETAIAEFLEAIPVKGFGSLLVVTQRWIAVGKKLAKLEEMREDLEAEQAATQLGSEAVNRLRARWIRLISQVLSLLDLSDANPSAVARIRNPILRASARASKRYDAPATAEEVLDEDEDDEDEDADIEPEAVAATGT